MSYTFLKLAYEVLKKAKQPMIYQDIWQVAKEMGITDKLSTKGKTPWQSLGARLYVEVRDNENSKFVKVGNRPIRFFLKVRKAELSADTAFKLEREDEKKVNKKIDFNERDLHPLLTYYVYAVQSFNRGRAIYTKTIKHEKSVKGGYNEWIHPDIVGFYLPLEDWSTTVIEFNRLSDNNALHLFSFEIKRELTKSNYRESYFQAVSNSSWAHEGYLVAAIIQQEDEFFSELERLASSFGIGIIELNHLDPDSSRILYPARVKQSLDWETINKLCKQNSEFEKFLQDVRRDSQGNYIHRAEYDLIPKDMDKYIKDKMKIEPVSV